MAERHTDEQTDERGTGKTLKRRGILAAAGAMVAGLAAKQLAQPVAATTGNTTGGALILGANGLFSGTDNTANNMTRLSNTNSTAISVGSGFTGDAFVAVASGGGVGVSGISNLNGAGVSGQVYFGDSTSKGVYGGSLDGKGVYGSAGSNGANSTPVGVYGVCNGNTFSKGVFGQHSYNGYGVYGLAGDGGWGVTGVGTTAYGVVASSTSGTALSASTTSGVYGVYGSSGASGGCGVRGDCTGGYGVLGSVSDGFGVLGQADTGNGVRGYSNQNHAVVGQTGRAYYGGVFGVATINNTVGIYGSTKNGATNNANAFAGYMDGNFVVANGFKSAAVKHTDGSHRLVYCMESPENWFEDFGKAKLVNGAADVAIDADFAAIVQTDDYHIFLSEYGASNHLFVAKQSAARFTVQSEKPGASGSFSYRIVAKRKDIKAERLAKFDLVGRAKVDASAPKPPPPPDAPAKKA